LADAAYLACASPRALAVAGSTTAGWSVTRTAVAIAVGAVALAVAAAVVGVGPPPAPPPASPAPAATCVEAAPGQHIAARNTRPQKTITNRATAPPITPPRAPPRLLGGDDVGDSLAVHVWATASVQMELGPHAWT
jgi:hypothetical protein